ncbi:MAG: cytochrome c [Arenicellales bacterium]
MLKLSDLQHIEAHMTQSKLISALSVAALLLAASPLSVMAADGATLYKTKTCSACHGKDGRTPLMPNYPKIAGQNSAYTLQQMKDIKSGARNNGQTASMKGVMHLVTDEEMQALSDYLATLAP